MYDCEIHFYLAGRQCGVFELLERLPVLEKFSHEFVKSVSLDSAAASGADVIFANLQGMEAAGAVRMLADARKKGSELILLAEKGQIESLATELEDIRDIWVMPMPEAEAKFRVQRWQQAYQDTMQERNYEEELLQRNHTLESIFKALDCGVLCHTLDGSRIISINKAALTVLGYASQEEMEAEGFDRAAMYVLDEDKEKLWKGISRLKKEGDSISVEYRMRHKDGKLLHIVENVKLMRENGELFFQRLFLDHTEQKRKEKEITRHQMEMLQALSTDFSFVCFFDMDTGIGTPIKIHDVDTDMDYDEEFTLDWGLEFYIQNAVYEEDREMFRQVASAERLAKEVSEKRIYYVKYRIVHEGEIQYYQLKAVRVGEGRGEHGILVGFRSVDDETREDLRKKTLLEDALFQANKANRAKSTFLSNMSHDIRTPMNAIVGFTSLAITHIERTDLVKEYLRKIMLSGNHLLNLINDILDMSRIESGKIQLEETRCSLPEVLQGLRSILMTNVQEKQLELSIDMGNVADEEIYCDKLRLNQVLLNLLGNAVKYTEAGGHISMLVSEKPCVLPGSASYEFYIKDTGIGMSAEFVERIFEPFERERNSTISKIQGTGLGMAITKNIVDMMNGSIEVKSEQGKGTEVTVSFTFRLYSGEEGKAGVPELKEERTLAADEDKKIHTGRLLLVEDNEMNQEIAMMVLEEAGFHVEVAENGQAAVDMVREAEPGYYQLILMDVQMPVMNGYKATAIIRGLEEKGGSSIPILAMTADAFEEDKRMALECGMNGHIAKPIDIGKLLDTLKDVLAR